MAQQDPETTTKTSKTTTTEQPVIEQPTPAQQPKRTLPKLSAAWWVLIALFGFFALLGLFAIGSAAMHLASDRSTRTITSYGTRGMMVQSDGASLRGGGMMGGRGGFDDSNTDTSTTRVSGVVTSVDGTTITVAGNGTTTKVVVNDSTTYIGDDKPAAVNDTIMVVGTKSGDTFTATRVILQRQ